MKHKSSGGIENEDFDVAVTVCEIQVPWEHTDDWPAVDCPECLARGVEEALTPKRFEMTREVGESDDAFRRRCLTTQQLAADLLDDGEEVEVVAVKNPLDGMLEEMVRKGLING